jgi:hypothetical protein
MPRLADLDARLRRITEEPYTGDFCAMPVDTDESYRAWEAAGRPLVRRTEMRERHYPVDSLAEASSITFKCPKCGGHRVSVTFAGRGVPDHLGSQNDQGQPSRWDATGTWLADLTLRPSIWLNGAGCGWHGFVTNGDAA